MTLAPTALGDLAEQDSPILSSETMKKFGITRVGDVTELDVIGLPVWAAYRPNSRSLSVSQGKGLNSGHARLTAVMEAVETAVAEQPKKLTTCFASIEEMDASGKKLVTLEGTQRVKGTRLDRFRQRAWVKGHCLPTGEAVFAPFELVGLDMRSNMPWDHTSFQMSSQGLAAGFDRDRTISHALFELIENDAMRLCELMGYENSLITLAYVSGLNEDLDYCVSRLSERGCQPFFFELTTHLEIPVILAFIPRQVVGRNGPLTRYAAGLAARASVLDAALASLLEAVQSRLTDIAGARDDLDPSRYKTNVHPPKPKYGETRLMSKSGNLFQSETTKSSRDLVSHINEKAPDSEVYIFDLNTGVDGLVVFRALSSHLTEKRFNADELSAFSLTKMLHHGRLT